MADKYKEGEIVGFYHGNDWWKAKFVCEYEGDYLVEPQQSMELPEFVRVSKSGVDCQFVLQTILIEYLDAYNALECALNQGYPGLAALPELMKGLGFEVPEDTKDEE